MEYRICDAGSFSGRTGLSESSDVGPIPTPAIAFFLQKCYKVAWVLRNGLEY